MPHSSTIDIREKREFAARQERKCSRLWRRIASGALSAVSGGNVLSSSLRTLYGGPISRPFPCPVRPSAVAASATTAPAAKAPEVEAPSKWDLCVFWNAFRTPKEEEKDRTEVQSM